MTKYFGTNGIRGLFHELSPMLALKAAQAFGIWTKREKKREKHEKKQKHERILVGRDIRLTGQCLASAVKSGLASVGCEAIDLAICSAPAAEFMLKKEKADGLIIITASHNPPEQNALKFIDGKGITISKERGEEIEKIMDSIKHADWNEVKAMKEITNTTAKHIAAIEKNIDLEKIKKARLNIVVDFGNGTSSLYLKMFERIAKVNAINAEVNGRFPGRPSEPTEANISKLIKLVKEGSYDCGFAWDCDADRFVAVDEKGNFVIGDKIFALSVLFKFRKTGKIKGKIKQRKIVTTVATSKAAEDIATKYNARTIYTKVGAPYLSEAILLENADIAGEEVGGVIWKEISLAKDGLATAMKMLEAIAEKPLSMWVAELPRYYNAKTKIPVPKEKKREIIEKFAAMQKMIQKDKITDMEIITIDGVRVNFPDCWIIVRASGTEDYIRVFAEAKTAKNAAEQIKKYEEIIKNNL
ncbi:MAG: phosphoglucosamine mutase [Candidatus Micrarchaeota archaeon]